MHTIAMDTYAFIPGGDMVVECVVTRPDPGFSSSTGRQTLVPGGFPARRGQANDGENRPIAPACERPFAAR